MRICIINTGGTISSTGQPLAPMAADRFARAANDLLGPALAAALPGDALHFDTGLRFSDDGPGTLDSTDLLPLAEPALAAVEVIALDRRVHARLHGLRLRLLLRGLVLARVRHRGRLQIQGLRGRRDRRGRGEQHEQRGGDAAAVVFVA